MNNSNNYDVKAIISLVLGILSLLTFWAGYGALFGLACGIIGIVLGVMARKENPSGIATAGLVTSWIGVILCAIVFVACVACVGCFSLAAAFSY